MVGVSPIEDKFSENKLRCFGHMQRRPVYALINKSNKITFKGMLGGRGNLN